MQTLEVLKYMIFFLFFVVSLVVSYYLAVILLLVGTAFLFGKGMVAIKRGVHGSPT